MLMVFSRRDAKVTELVDPQAEAGRDNGRAILLCDNGRSFEGLSRQQVSTVIKADLPLCSVQINFESLGAFGHARLKRQLRKFGLHGLAGNDKADADDLDLRLAVGMIIDAFMFGMKRFRQGSEISCRKT